MARKTIIGKLQLLGLAVALGALAGCASTGDLSKIKATADNAAQAASAAQSSAAAANSTAIAAAQKADAAAAKADRADHAEQVAQSASAKADQALRETKEINEKLDRMFKKGMQK